MADISKITLPSNDEYNIKDATARSELSGKQDVITADGILQGDGEGNITAADTTATGTLSNPSSDGTYVLQNIISSGTSTLSWGTGGSGSDTDSDENVKQTAGTPSSYSYWRPLVIGNSSSSTEGGTVSTSTGGTYVFNTITGQPSTGTIRIQNLTLYKESYKSTFTPESLSANRTITVPNKTGTLALTSDIPDVSGLISSESDPIFSASAAAGITSTDITNWNGKASGSHTHGDITNTGDITATAPTIENGDQLIINDNSASKITNGPTFDGSTTNKYLSPKGTWENIPDISGKIDTAGTGLSKSGTTLNHSNSITAQSTSGVYPIKIDAQGHITEYGSAISYITPPSTVSAGDVLTYDSTNGWVAAEPASGLPAQSSSTDGKILQSTYDSQTSTASASWESLESVSTLTVDSAPVASSTNLVTSGGVYSAISNIEVLPSQTNNSGKFLTTNGTTASWATVDALPSQSGNSGKYLTTNGSVASWGDTSTATALGVETAPSSGSSNLVTSGGVYTAINNKVNRTTAVNAADTNYSTVMARGISIGTTDLVDGTSSLASGTIYIYYEQ